MTPATPHSIAAPAQAPVTCVADGGCSYLRALSTIERLAGFEQSASSFASAASRCQRLGCWAAEGGRPRVRTSERDEVLVRLDTDRSAPKRDAGRARCGAIAPIPFIRSSLVDSLSDAEGNYVERRAVKLSTLPGPGDPLGHIYDYWCGLRAETDCRFSNIDTVRLIRAGIVGNVHVVDVTSSDPEQFRFELTGYAIPLGHFDRPRVLPIPIYADTTMRDYNTARLTGAPRLHRVRARLRGTSHHYTRLILPFFDSQGRVARLLVAIRQERGDNTQIEAGN